MHELNDGTKTSSPYPSTFTTAEWLQVLQETTSDRTPFARILPSVAGGPEYRSGFLLARASSRFSRLTRMCPLGRRGHPWSITAARSATKPSY
jgi:hypothetical protein